MIEEGSLKLYVWERVLWDYTPGMAVILAHSLGEAIEVMKRQFPQNICEQLPLCDVKIVTEPDGFYVTGGG